MQLGVGRRVWLGSIVQRDANAAWRRLLFALALTLTPVSPAHTQEVTVARLPVIRVEINAFFDQYYEWFSASRADLLAERVYAAPFYVGDGTIHQTREEVQAWATGLLGRLSARGYARSEMPDRKICVLSDGFAVVSGYGFRYKEDGSLLGEYGWVYTVMRTDDGWRITSTFSHAREDLVQGLVRCDG